MNWKDLARSLGKFAPAIGTAVGGPAGGVVGTMVARRLDVEPTPEAVEAAIAADPDALVKLREIETDLQRAAMADMQHAREAHRGHWMPPVLTLILCGMACALGYAVFFVSAPQENRELLNIIFGGIMVQFANSVAYWIGSSRGSADKQAALERGR